MATGSYTMDGHLNFECNNPCNEDPDNPAFDIMNATGGAEIEEQTSDTNGDTVYYYRIRVPLASNLILKDFPFDYHYLTMHMEDKILGEDELTYEFDQSKSGVDDFAIVSGWEVEREIKGEIIPHQYAIYTSLLTAGLQRGDLYSLVLILHEGSLRRGLHHHGRYVVLPDEI